MADFSLWISLRRITIVAWVAEKNCDATLLYNPFCSNLGSVGLWIKLQCATFYQTALRIGAD
jgi:hypothetical protein